MAAPVHNLSDVVTNPQDRPSKLFTAPLPSQRDLYQTRDSKIRECLREEIDAWAKQLYPGLDPRTMYAEAMSLACEEHISRATINNWCAQEGNQLPANKLYGHVLVTGSKRIVEIALEGAPISVSDREDSLYARKGRLEAEIAERQRKVELIELEIREGRI